MYKYLYVQKYISPTWKAKPVYDYWVLSLQNQTGHEAEMTPWK